MSGGNIAGILALLRGATGSPSSSDLMQNMVYKGIAGSLLQVLGLDSGSLLGKAGGMLGGLLK